MYQIKQCREMRGLTQNFVALSLGVKPPSVNGWESGKSKPTLDNLIALAELLNVSTDMLLGIAPVSGKDVSDSVSEEYYTLHEKELVIAYRKQSDVIQRAICDILHIAHPGNLKANGSAM